MPIADFNELKVKYNIVGRDPRLDGALDTALQVAFTDLSVLIQGESGVGKDVIPRIIHDHSPRKRKRYIPINCGSIPEGTIDSELFGHVKGAFTGAIADHEGYFGAADGGTLFLDEVGELPLSTQARLLRVLETGDYICVGSNEPRHTDVRIVAATNVNLQRAIREGKFREDLYFRLCTISIKMPPLRERGEDVLTLFKKFSMDMAEKYRIAQPLRLSPEAEKVFLSYKWPGNIRQLRNLAEQMSILCDQRVVTPDMLQEYGIVPGSESTDMATIGGKNHDDVVGYEKERPIIFALLNTLTHEVEELKKMVAGGYASPVLPPASNIQNVDAGTHALEVAPTHHSIEVAPSHHSIEVAPTHHSIEVPPSAPRFQRAELVEVETEAELIEENADLNLEKMERKMIEESLRRNRYKRKLAALELGISERTLYRKIKDYGLEEGAK